MRAINADVAIIGAGPAGLAAAIAAKDEGASVIVLERDVRLGGILNQCIHAGFGLHAFGVELTGPEYAGRYIRQMADTDIGVYLETMVLDIEKNLSITAVNSACGLLKIQASAIVLAMGCRERPRGALNIPGSRPAGVYTAGTAQRLINIEGKMVGKRALVLGSGDIGLIMARRLTYEGAKVLAVCEVMPYSSGLSRNVVQCLDDLEIPLMLSYTAVDIHGRERVEGVTVAKVDERRKPIPGTERFFDCDTLLLSVGLIPENELSLKVGVALAPNTGGPSVDNRLMTNVPGVFACGNVLHVHDLVDYVSEEAQNAGKQAARYAFRENGEEQLLDVVLGENVRYVVPQRVSAGPATLRFRVTSPVRRPIVSVVQGNETLYRQRKLVCTPGEMETVRCEIKPGKEPVMVEVKEAK